MVVATRAGALGGKHPPTTQALVAQRLSHPQVFYRQSIPVGESRQPGYDLSSVTRKHRQFACVRRTSLHLVEAREIAKKKCCVFSRGPIGNFNREMSCVVVRSCAVACRDYAVR